MEMFQLIFVDIFNYDCRIGLVLGARARARTCVCMCAHLSRSSFKYTYLMVYIHKHGSVIVVGILQSNN